jgi:hypothetical protein
MRPVCRFVARLTGTHNIFPGYAERNDTHSTIVLGGMQRERYLWRSVLKGSA